MGTTHPTRTIAIRESVLDENEAIARRNRRLFDTWGCCAVNMLSSPGSGKTSLLERTLGDMSAEVAMAVIVGDLATDNDARRLGGRGAPALQITTGDICHLDASMIARALGALPEPHPALLFIENVGNMVCPAAFDLGEHARVALVSVTEGEDKPLKYPTLFRSAHAVVITKTDIADAVGFDDELMAANLRAAAPGAEIMRVSSRNGSGLDHWYAWLRARIGKGHVNGDTGR